MLPDLYNNLCESRLSGNDSNICANEQKKGHGGKKEKEGVWKEGGSVNGIMEGRK